MIGKQSAARFYRIPAFVIADAVVRLPLAAFDTVVFGTLVYWLAGLNPQVGTYLFFLLAIGLLG